MKQIKSIFLTSVLGLMMVVSCSKKDSSEPNAETKFTWSYNGTIYTAKQYSARLTGIGAPSIIAGLQENIYAPGSGPRINLTSLQQGSYPITLNGSNQFIYVDELGDQYAGSAGSLEITKNTGTAINGSFSVTLSNNKVITGEFTNTKINP